MRLNKLRKATLIITILIFGISLQAQVGIDSPYTRFGVGNLAPKSVNAQQQAMGGIGNTISSNRFINPANPASYIGIDSMSFLFNLGINSSAVTYETANQKEKGNYAQLSYFSLGFPVTNKWKIGIGLIPYSTIGYNVIVSGVSPQNINYNKSYEGSGGLSQVYFGNAFRLTKDLSLGVNAGFVFGRNTAKSFLYFPDSAYMANTKSESRITAHDFVFDYGLLYAKSLNENYKLSIGLTYAQKINLSVEREYLVQSQFGGTEGTVEYPLDTVFYSPATNAELNLPHRMGFGVGLEKKDSWMVGADFNWQKWEDFQLFESSDSLINSWNVAVGGAFTPNNTSISGYWKRVTYRAGVRYHQTYLEINGQPVNEFGISFGVGLPLPRTMTTIDLSLEAGQRGMVTNGLIKETFVNFTLGVCIYERWFIKRKYN